MGKVFKQKNRNTGQNIEISNVNSGVGINLTAREYDDSKKLLKTCWITFPVEQAKQIVELIWEKINICEERKKVSMIRKQKKETEELAHIKHYPGGVIFKVNNGGEEYEHRVLTLKEAREIRDRLSKEIIAGEKLAKEFQDTYG